MLAALTRSDSGHMGTADPFELDADDLMASVEELDLRDIEGGDSVAVCTSLRLHVQSCCWCRLCGSKKLLMAGLFASHRRRTCWRATQAASAPAALPLNPARLVRYSASQMTYAAFLETMLHRTMRSKESPAPHTLACHRSDHPCAPGNSHDTRGYVPAPLHAALLGHGPAPHAHSADIHEARHAAEMLALWLLPLSHNLPPARAH
jgi:hypothetical protein